MTQLKSKKVVITGGASGIGKEMAKIVLSKGISELVLWDYDAVKLDETVVELQSWNIPVHSFVVDVSDTGQIILAARKTLDLIGKADILINNAGILIGKMFHEHSHEDITREMNINALGYMHVAREFLPSMIEQRSGHICNVASAAGLLGNPRMSIYCASKAAVINWADSLRIEMDQMKTNVKVTIVTPNYIHTDMIPGVKSVIPILKKEVAAKKIIRGIERNKAFVRMQFIVSITPILKAILSIRMFDFFVGKLLGVYNTMNGFKKN
ncbi:MAG TPA: SDR family NAD(P)-dependent oxidoreductase [Prolixibacteraceae bacterium]|nr:SDR family NAD(P)-dependent oxidoreductase [Prolixibacteraceae bacterium]